MGERRAKSVANLLIDKLDSKKEFIPDMELIDWDIKWIGQGEALPDTGKRRGAVSIIWNLLPSAYAN
ncbi:hypothetical protein [Niastella yeongjuensis]|uniref:hypothetical protein n=1 Tax=Niastella yeongjuensis TaxID=354355 RepID=UPI0009BF8C45|nr:hypothetical protein [Niastella yeongjuensis]